MRRIDVAEIVFMNPIKVNRESRNGFRKGRQVHNSTLEMTITWIPELTGVLLESQDVNRPELNDVCFASYNNVLTMRFADDLLKLDETTPHQSTVKPRRKAKHGQVEG